LQRNHAEAHQEVDTYQAKKKQKKETAVSSQPKIVDYTKSSPVMEIAVDMVIENAVPFELFGSSAMRQMNKLAKKGCGDNSSRVINPDTVKQALLERAKKKREELIQMLEGKIINLSADFATCWSRSFFGE
jgi:hypothetical protein